jgi:hypothetical protein
MQSTPKKPQKRLRLLPRRRLRRMLRKLQLVVRLSKKINLRRRKRVLLKPKNKKSNNLGDRVR